MKSNFLLIIAVFFLQSLSLNAQETPVTHSELPKEARNFLSKHFKSPFHHAIKEMDNRKVEYDVMLEDGTKIEFSETGKWKEVDGNSKALPTSFIQKTILDYVKVNYPKEQIIKIERTDFKYEVDLNNGLELEFNAKGDFVKID